MWSDNLFLMMLYHALRVTLFLRRLPSEAAPGDIGTSCGRDEWREGEGGVKLMIGVERVLSGSGGGDARWEICDGGGPDWMPLSETGDKGVGNENADRAGLSPCPSVSSSSNSVSRTMASNTRLLKSNSMSDAGKITWCTTPGTQWREHAARPCLHVNRTC
jgi:hypothetical protein